MKDDEKISLGIYSTIKSVKDVLTLPMHNTLEKTLYYSIALLLCSIISELLGFYTFISWQGCLLCIVALVYLLFIERSENDALLKMYRTARLSAEKAVRRAKTAGSSVNGRRNPKVSNKRTKDAGE